DATSTVTPPNPVATSIDPLPIPNPRNAWPTALTTPTSGSEPSPPTNLEPNEHGSNDEYTRITGCLAQAPTTLAPTRSLTPSGAESGETWRATTLGSSVVVTHTLRHACCLRGQATATLSEATITIEERLTGQPCRCVCESTIQTRLPVKPGEYEVQSV